MEQLLAFLPVADVTLSSDVLDAIDEIVAPASRSTRSTTAMATWNCAPASDAADARRTGRSHSVSRTISSRDAGGVADPPAA
ncbi:hypothetical protein [Streptomyces sp. NPDC054842]